MKKLLLIPALVLGLGACAAFEDNSAKVAAAKILILTCDQFATVADELTPLVVDGTVSDSDLDRIERAVEVADLACSPDATIDPVNAVAVVESAIDSLNTLVETL